MDNDQELIARLHEIAHRDSAVSVTVQTEDLRTLLSKLRAPVADERKDYCPEKRKPGGCQLHNLHCGYPKCNEPPAPSKDVQQDTGNPEADRLIGRLMSSDPDFDDCAAAAQLIRLLASAPVADERAQDVNLPWLRAYLHHQIASDRWVVTADQARDFARAAVLADRQARAALASAPVVDNWQQYALPGETTAEQVCERMNAEVTRRTIAAMQASAPVAGSSDRAMLQIVLQDLENSDSVCPQCGHSDSCADMDVAYMIRDHLKGEASAPVADERVSDDTLWSWAEQVMGGKEAHHVGRDRVLRYARMLLASAPVAGEAITDPMIQAGAKAAREYFEQTGGNSPAVIYKAMRDAAPQASDAVRFLENEAAKLDAQRRPSGAVVRDIARRLSAALSAQPGAKDEK